MKRIALLMIIAAALSSCGGGGGGAAVHPATQFRDNQIGDSWYYSVNINFGKFGSYIGTLTEGLTADTYNNQASIRDTQTFLLGLSSGPSTITSYSELSPQGVLLADMENATLYPVTSNTFSVGSTIGPTTSTSGVVTLSNGDTTTETYKVVGAEMVKTYAGTYACWIISQKVVNSNGTKDTFTIWMAPEIGNYVRITDVTVNPDGTGYTYTASLTGYVTAPTYHGNHGQASTFHLPNLRSATP